MEKYIEGYIHDGRIGTEPPYWITQNSGEVHMNGEIIVIPEFRKKLKELIDNPKPSTWYHAYFVNGETYFESDSHWCRAIYEDGELKTIPYKRLGSILTAKQNWWQKLFNIVRLPTLTFNGDWYCFTESSGNIGKFTKPKGIKVIVHGWFYKRKGD